MTQPPLGFIHLVMSDLYRYHGDTSIRRFLKSWLVIPGFRYSFSLRLTRHLHDSKNLLLRIPYWISRLYLRHLEYKFGIQIPFQTSIGSGLYIGHFNGIVVNGRASLGQNCNLSHGVTIGQASRGPRQGCPRIGNNVYIGPGAVIIGNIHVGNNCAIGANCVVTKDVPNNAVVVGVPGKVISLDGSSAYVTNTIGADTSLRSFDESPNS